MKKEEVVHLTKHAIARWLERSDITFASIRDAKISLREAIWESELIKDKQELEVFAVKKKPNDIYSRYKDMIFVMDRNDLQELRIITIIVLETERFKEVLENERAKKIVPSARLTNQFYHKELLITLEKEASNYAKGSTERKLIAANIQKCANQIALSNLAPALSRKKFKTTDERNVKVLALKALENQLKTTSKGSPKRKEILEEIELIKQEISKINQEIKLQNANKSQQLIEEIKNYGR